MPCLSRPSSQSTDWNWSCLASSMKGECSSPLSTALANKVNWDVQAQVHWAFSALIQVQMCCTLPVPNKHTVQSRKERVSPAEAASLWIFSIINKEQMYIISRSYVLFCSLWFWKKIYITEKDTVYKTRLRSFDLRLESYCNYLKRHSKTLQRATAAAPAYKVSSFGHTLQL